jgi:membrane protease YdiL (CAAX protease family)
MTLSWMDHALVLGFAVAWPAWALRSHRAYRERVRAGVVGARLAGYAHAAITQWLLASLAVGLWIHASRDWSEIGLAVPAGLRPWAALAVAGALGGLMLAQSAAVEGRPETHGQVRAAVAPMAELLPADRSDLHGFVALSITAGVCEEVLFRGLLPWYLAQALGPWGGQALALAAFGAAHAYLGATAVVRAVLAGLVAAALYVWSGSLLPSMLLHALVDVAGGWMAYVVLRDPGPVEGAAAAG